MKQNVYIFLVIIALTLVSACSNELIGFLEIDENAGYAKDSLEVFQNPPTSSNQYKYGTPYTTTAVEGVQGTFPMTYSLAHISGNNPEGVQKLQEIIDVKYGIGKIVIPAKHDLPVGRYSINIQVENSYGKFEIQNALIVIVKP